MVQRARKWRIEQSLQAVSLYWVCSFSQAAGFSYQNLTCGVSADYVGGGGYFSWGTLKEHHRKLLKENWLEVKPSKDTREGSCLRSGLDTSLWVGPPPPSRPDPSSRLNPPTNMTWLWCDQCHVMYLSREVPITWCSSRARRIRLVGPSHLLNSSKQKVVRWWTIFHVMLQVAEKKNARLEKCQSAGETEGSYSQTHDKEESQSIATIKISPRIARE